MNLGPRRFWLVGTVHQYLITLSGTDQVTIRLSLRGPMHVQSLPEEGLFEHPGSPLDRTTVIH